MAYKNPEVARQKARERYWSATPEQVRARKAYHKKYNASLSPEARAEKNARTREWIAANDNKLKEKRPAQRRRYNYGLSEDTYLQMLADQQNACAICRRQFSEMSSKNCHVDHCHATGVVRGILCTNCNTGLGKFKDSEDLLFRAGLYLQQRK